MGSKIVRIRRPFKNINQEHLEDLRKSGLSDKTIEAAGFYSVAPDQARDILVKDLPRVSLLAIPYPNTNFIRYKLFPPIEGKKYHQEYSSNNHAYVPHGFDPEAKVIYITEGEKKTLKGMQEGLNVIGLSGAWNYVNKKDGFRQPVEEFKQIDWIDK